MLSLSLVHMLMMIANLVSFFIRPPSRTLWLLFELLAVGHHHVLYPS